jgi:carotenoid cleavage dioxygenase-like enzyme
VTTTAPHLAGNYAPVPDEITTAELSVTGAIPPELAGWYLRNGPNPRDADSGHWFVGDGMVHGVRIRRRSRYLVPQPLGAYPLLHR